MQLLKVIGKDPFYKMNTTFYLSEYVINYVYPIFGIKSTEKEGYYNRCPENIDNAELFAYKIVDNQAKEYFCNDEVELRKLGIGICIPKINPIGFVQNDLEIAFN